MSSKQSSTKQLLQDTIDAINEAGRKERKALKQEVVAIKKAYIKQFGMPQPQDKSLVNNSQRQPIGIEEEQILSEA
jgi:hypothetical protein